MGLSAASVNRWAFTTREPTGVVFAISAFNHPLNLIVHQIVPAIAVGCPVIVKPADTTPLSCLDIVALVHEAGLPEDWCQTFIPTHTLLAEQLAADSRIGFLSFIGSAKVGWYLHSRLPRGARSALEHGGAAPAIVDRSAELDLIIEPIVRGGYYHAGQVCVSTQRIFVHEDIADDFTDRLISRVEDLRVGDPTLSETEVGPLINSGQVDRVVPGSRKLPLAEHRLRLVVNAFPQQRCNRRCFSIQLRTPRCRAKRYSGQLSASTAMRILRMQSRVQIHFQSHSRPAFLLTISMSHCVQPSALMRRLS